MTGLVPNRFLFDFELSVPKVASAPKIDGATTTWPDRARLPALGELDGASGFADVWLCWDQSGLYVAFAVSGKSRPPVSKPTAAEMGDHLCLCTDMRDARANRRGTRFCQKFHFLPVGGGRGGKQPAVVVAAIKRAREDAPTVDAAAIQIASKVVKSRYTVTAHIPAACLSGYDPNEHPRIGVAYMLTDGELGEQYLTVGDDLRWYVDPSTWATAVLEE